MRRTMMLVTAMVCVAALGLRADTYPRQTGFSITRYSFDLTLTDASNEIVVTDTVDMLFSAGGVTAIDLDLCDARPDRKAGATADPCMGRGAGNAGPGGGGLSGAANVATTPTGMTLTGVTSDGKPLRFTHGNDKLHVQLPASSQAGARFSFTVSYHGTPATGLQIGNNKYGDRGFFSNDWPQLARNWLAVIDHPSMKAPISMTVTAPRKYQVISNGLMIEATDLPNDLRRTRWREDVPIPSWQFSLGAAPFAVGYFGDYHGIALSAWVYPQERDDSFKGFGDYPAPILEFYSDHIGPYSYEKLAQVEATTVGGGMELASNIFYGYRGVPGRQLIAHEMAHQWFGDSVTEKDWDDVWLSEGFATYFALLYAEHEDGREAFLNGPQGVKSSAQSAIRYALANPTSPIVHANLADVSKVIANNAQIYQGGAQVLHMLRGVLGDNRFWAGIRLYYQRHRNSNATSDDFRHAMEDACVNAGNCPDEDKDLSWFFHEWLNRGGILQLAGSWHYDASAKQVIVTFDQTQTTGLYRMPMDLHVTAPPSAAPAGAAGGRGGAAGGRGGAAGPAGPAGPTRVWLDKAHQTFTIPSDTEPTDVHLDPQSWVTMMQATFVKK